MSDPTHKLNDNLPMIGRVEAAFYNKAKPNPKDATKTIGADIRLAGRWREMSPTGVKELGAGSVYLRAGLESDLIALGILAIASSDADGFPKYRVAHPGPIQILRTADGTKKVFAVTWAGAPGTEPPGPPAAVAPAAPIASVPPTRAYPEPTAPAAPVAAAPAAAPKTEEELLEERRARRAGAFNDWLEQGEALAVALALAHHAALVADVPFNEASLQAGAATLLIRAGHGGVTWRGLAAELVPYLAKKRAEHFAPRAAPKVTAAAPVAPVAPPTIELGVAAGALAPAAPARAPLAQAYANAGKRADGQVGSGGWPEPAEDGEPGPGDDDDLPF